ncbi:MAG: hypothetical protein COB61_011560 [Thiotrichales bacterium]|nr:hypothetical protein [Thiotrichales bacterium]
MVIVIAGKKGSTGKTPISLNIAKATDSIILTNDDDVVEEIHENARVMPVSEMAELDFTKLPNTVIDLGGYIEAGTISIIKRCDLVIIPVVNHISFLKRSISAVDELSKYNDNVIVIATKTKKPNDFKHIQESMKDFNIKAFFELKQTELFNNSMDMGLGIEDYLSSAPILRSAYGKRKNQKSASIMEQWTELVNYIKREIGE